MPSPQNAGDPPTLLARQDGAPWGPEAALLVLTPGCGRCGVSPSTGTRSLRTGELRASLAFASRRREGDRLQAFGYRVCQTLQSAAGENKAGKGDGFISLRCMSKNLNSRRKGLSHAS